jgi:hypothetical protein
MAFYQVDVPGPPSADGGRSPYIPNRYLLRILLTDHTELAEEEMMWLAALRREAGAAAWGWAESSCWRASAPAASWAALAYVGSNQGFHRSLGFEVIYTSECWEKLLDEKGL